LGGKGNRMSKIGEGPKRHINGQIVGWSVEPKAKLEKEEWGARGCQNRTMSCPRNESNSPIKSRTEKNGS